ncbi:arylsulfatase D isoform X1 [Danio rerio]|uniref:Arylsulfatase D isoform X1 n=3 Tax=Danio rerio TaxID=7955 RepID=A0A8M1RIV1_DANRE|nr:arylsulfatase D [Danio rerio]|eukprot:XP_003199313.1 arylsulfatase D [Danio rerio]
MKMMDSRSLRSVSALLLFLQFCWCFSDGDQKSRPNFVLMMVDDLGIGDIGCYGNTTIRTPNIDRLASDGVKLTHHLSAAPLCTPSRTAFMTGRYPLRAGMGSTGRVQVILFLAGSGGLPPNETTFAKLLQKQGYTTGIVGKWHLGVNCESRSDLCHHPNNHGFDFFYGLPFTLFVDCAVGAGSGVLLDYQEMLLNSCKLLLVCVLTLLALRGSGLLCAGWRLLFHLSAAALICFLLWFVPFGLLRVWNCILMRNGEVVEQPMNLQTLNSRLMREAEQFMERHRDGPFLLFVSFPQVHTPMLVTEGFAGKSRHGLYGDNVEEVDWMVGRVVDTIDRLGLTEKTLLYFTSDHGGGIEEGPRGGWNGIYRGGKAMGGWDGGIRVPGIFRWPGRLAAGREVAEPTSLMDVFPTVVKLAGGELPKDRLLDGHDLMPLLEGSSSRSQHEFMFHYCGMYLNAVRWHPQNSSSIYKVVFFSPVFSPAGSSGCFSTGSCMCHKPHVTYHSPPLVFLISSDPSESVPLTEQTDPRVPEVLQRVQRAVEEHRRSLTPVEMQLTWRKTLWRPWLQPCCGTFPYCTCSEEDTHTTG